MLYILLFLSNYVNSLIYIFAPLEIPDDKTKDNTALCLKKKTGLFGESPEINTVICVNRFC